MNVTLGGQVVHLLGLHLLKDADKVGGVCEVTIVQNKSGIRLVRILIKMVDTCGVE
jgi:hypothetical protein